MRTTLLLLALSAAAAGAAAARDGDRPAVARVLDRFHEAAAAADWDAYFGLMSEDAVFLGTDASERWPREAFREYAAGREGGWLYVPRERHIDFAPDGAVAWFDELLDNAAYGTSRGTGVLVRAAGGWRIAQYHLTFPIPNELARRLTGEIKRFEGRP